MRTHLYPVALAGLLLIPALLRADDKKTYSIKLKKAVAGDVSAVAKDEKLTSKIQGKQGDDTVLDEMNVHKEHFQFKEETLSVDDKGHAVKLRRTYDKASKTKDDTTDDYFIQGKTIIIEKKADEKKFRFTIDGGKEITGDDASPLDKEFNEKDSEIDEDEILLPQGAVALDESWNINKADELFKQMVDKDDDVVLDLKHAKGTGKLAKVYKKDDQQWGVIEYKLTVPVKTIGSDTIKFKMEEGSVFTFSIVMDTCIDGKTGSGTVTSKFGVKGKGIVKSGGTEVAVEIDIQGHAKDVVDEEKSK